MRSNCLPVNSWPTARWVPAAATVLFGAAIARGGVGPFRFACPSHGATGLWCPGCGGTRSLRALARLDIGAALDAHPLVVFAVPLVAALAVSTQRRRRAIETVSTHPTALFAGLAVFAVARNLPIEAAGLLAPP